MGGHRSACTLLCFPQILVRLRVTDESQIPREFNGRYERLFILKDSYDAAVTAAGDAATARTDPEVERTGLRLARAQKTVTKSLQQRRIAAARSGQRLTNATSNPTTTQDFLALILVEQRGIRTALESVCSHLYRMWVIANSYVQIAATALRANTGGAGNDDDDSDSGSAGSL